MTITVLEKILRQDLERLRADNSLLKEGYLELELLAAERSREALEAATKFQEAMDSNAELLKALEAYAEEFGETGYYHAVMDKVKG